MKTPAAAFFCALVSLVLTATSPMLHAADEPGTKDHPDFKRIEGSEIIWGKVAKFDEFIIPLEKVQFDYDKTTFKETKKDKAEGAHTTLYYKLPGETATLEAVRQYQEELKPAGYATLFTAANDELDDGYGRFVERTFPTAKKTDQLQYLHEFNKEEQRYAVMKGKGKAGNDIYVSVYAFVLNDVSTGFDKLVEGHKLQKGETVVRVDILETKPMDTRMAVVKAEEITSTIAATGRIAIYGVYFDTDKAELKDDSAEALAEMAKAIKGDGGRYLIVGHTDNQGDYAHNQTLSQKRAQAVTAALSKQYGIPAASIIAVGVGMAAPVAPNADETGRSKNRRVEIVKM
ncbi:MAG: outer membrane protein OmpA [Akkermansiaceae bacterium]|nr:outer membrane protein OmpA [Akkermansiaceae bacterium]